MTARPYDRVKRVIDALTATTVLIISAPVQATVALLIRTRMGSPVLFRQARPGLHGEVFTLLKFRTMHVPSEGRETDEQRLTALGRFLRSTSLDELPTLTNVVRGDMSLVGPRPLLVEYLERYSPREARRHEVRPGITGLAQIDGRNNVAWPRRLELDVDYVERRSLRLDLHIMLRTILPVLMRRDVNQAGTASMTPFSGSDGG